MNALVCIILINYNTYADTVECVKSLREMNYSNYRIILVDNASKDAPTIKHDAYLNANCDIILAEHNKGFSAGNNIGIRYAQEKYDPDFFWVLNNDTVVEKDSLSLLVATAERRISEVGLVTGRIHCYSQRDQVDCCGGRFDYECGRASYYPKSEPVHDEITFAIGCCWLIPRHTIENIGYLDEKFFMYAEDTDYCCRIYLAGYKILYCDESIIYHKISASAGRCSDFTAYYMMRNDLYVMQRYATNKWKAWYKFFRILLGDIVKRRKKLGVSVKAIGAFIRKETGRSEEY
jgi:GT2 family glycosyltransferase